MGTVGDGLAKGAPSKAKLGRIADLLDASGVDIDEIGRIDKVRIGEHEMVTKRRLEDGTEVVETHTLRADSLQVVPTWADGPDWPVVQPASPAKVTYGRRPKPHNDDMHRTVILPDPQIGFWRVGDDMTLVPTHDEQAMAAALTVARAVRPDRIVNLGDFLDLAEFSSKFHVWPEFAATTQAALDRGHAFLAEQRAILGPQAVGDDLVLIAGNHDDRIGKAIVSNAKHALRLRRADDPTGWPAMSVPNLLALDALDCTYVDGYPAGSIRLADGTDTQTPLYAVHERGLDVVKVARQQRQSYIQGHTHRVAIHCETYELDDKPIDVEAYALGSLCSRTGRVPSSKGTPDERGMPVNRIESWQHAVGVLTVAPSGAWWVEVVRIRDGEAVAAGQRWTS